MPRSVLDAIKMGMWDFDPEFQQSPELGEYSPTQAMPGSPEKLAVLSDRLRRGLPLWHPRDRITYDKPPWLEAIVNIDDAHDY